MAAGARLIRNRATGPVVRAFVSVYARALLAARTKIECDMTTVSDVMADLKLARVSLLKIDVERAEMIVLGGVKQADWAKIDQVAVEIHDADGRSAKIQELLRANGFKRFHVEADKNLGGSILMLHATR